ncbi:hypothetical protein [Mesorhizobium sp. B2-4-5]|uniref:hypothetical protein n=1 Tax=Mesorhizobium sp. B2-4-5 TaxID=2589944 RepID=UPI0011261FD1|nr:hypothetical protein [Mesorhizobium sp. B2-4-5]TPL42589.1 hypothetical protein FJ961_07825 [Mesorhizobium sp. B2-4-5]
MFDTIKVHFFDSTGEAYDATQCDETIQNGDVLIIPDEKVVGLADTWPVAVTKQAGHLHSLADGNFETYHHEFGKDAGKRVFTDVQIRAAKAIAKEWGYELQAAEYPPKALIDTAEKIIAEQRAEKERRA